MPQDELRYHVNCRINNPSYYLLCGFDCKWNFILDYVEEKRTKDYVKFVCAESRCRGYIGVTRQHAGHFYKCCIQHVDV